MNGYTFEEVAKAIEDIDSGVSLVIADLPTIYDRTNLSGKWCVKTELHPAYSTDDICDIYMKIKEKLDEYCLKTERDVLMGKFWLSPIVEMEA